MRKVTLPIMLGLMLLPAATAAAKEPVAAKICGPSDCTTTKDKDTLMAFFEGGGPGSPPAHGVPWYTVRTAIDIGQKRPDHFEQVVIPQLGVVRGQDETGSYMWMSLSDRAAREYRRLTRDMEAFPASELKGTGPVEAKVDEVILPPKQEPAAAADGGSSPLPWIAGGLVLLGVVFALIRWRGRPWPRPAQG
jgi:hypothetical protein